MSRVGEVVRKTHETDIKVKVELDGNGNCRLISRVKFLNHMLETFSRHSKIDLELEADGDLIHHIVEDVAICLGNAISDALGDRKGIKRFGYAIIPMDDALLLSSIDLRERPYSAIEMKLPERIEDVSSEDMIHFFRSFATSLRATIHIYELYGSNAHHKVEAAMKALAISIRNAISEDR